MNRLETSDLVLWTVVRIRKKKYIFVCVRVTPKTDLSKCAAAMMHILIVKFSFAVQSMVWPTSCWPNNSLLAGGPNYLSSQPQQFILTEEALSPDRERSYETWYALHCIVCNNIKIRGLRQVCKNLHTLSPSNSPSDTHRLTTKYTCKGGFKFQVSTCVCWFWVLAWFRLELGWFQLVFTGFGF